MASNHSLRGNMSQLLPLTQCKIFAARIELDELLHSLQRPVDNVILLFTDEHDAQMSQNHRCRLAEWLFVFKQRYYNLQHEFFLTKLTFDEIKQEKLAEQAVTTLVTSPVSPANRPSLTSLPMELQCMIFSYLVQPPPCKHYFYGATWSHKMIDTDLTSPDLAIKTRLLEKSPAVEMTPDGFLWTLCHASRNVMQRAYSKWIDEMLAHPFCHNDDRVNHRMYADSEEEPATNVRRNRNGNRNVYCANPNWMTGMAFIQWTNADGPLRDDASEYTASDSDVDDDENDDDGAA
ncbi:hypothetical protein Sste5346_006085 [Sporothrix stenoceras]|uniref:F-box domain-containing protein n=1 Tax=Sporothrix stenoceras TaxID=5173 RepID=A0ABR3Z357_9PEZI